MRHHTTMSSIRIVALVAVMLGSLGFTPELQSPSPGATDVPVVITSVSNRADMVSGGDVLVELTLPDGSPPTDFIATLDGVDVTDAFALRQNGRVQGLITSLSLGENILRVTRSDGEAAELTITDHPVGGPIFSGQQVQPWACSTAAHGLGEPVDAQCNAPRQQRWRYRTTGGSWAEYDVANPPTDVADTTTDQGVTVPYVFVVETGAMNRGVYRFAMLADPTVPLKPWNQPRGWNGGIYYKFGASCGTHYGQGTFIENVEDSRPLSSGYAVATSTLSVLGSNCNTVTSAESVMMIEERMAELFGAASHVRGKGGSGGSIGQHVVASGYPGLLQGLNVDLSFEDFWTTHKEVTDCHILQNYFTTTSPHLWADARAQGQVMGHMSVASCAVWETSFAPLLDPTTGCGAGESYHPVDKPTGCRATVQDMQVNLLGRRTPDQWTAAERAAGYGFAELPYDNTGQLYGLRALQVGDITPEQFVDLNEKVGGIDVDGGYQGSRSEADADVVETLYRGGMVASGLTLSEVPIIDVRAFTGNAEIHSNFHSYAMAERLASAQGHHDNHSIWKLFEVPNLPSIAGPQAFGEMSKWLHAMDADSTPGTIQEKVARNRPAGAGDSCIFQDQRSEDQTLCAWFSYYGTPLTASGGPMSNDVLKCSRRPLPIEWPAGGGYGPTPFTPSVAGVAGQWDRLLTAFPDGVCDYSVAGVGQVPVQPWTTFAAGPGGMAMGPAPVATPIG
jgi:hypothetical protein